MANRWTLGKSMVNTIHRVPTSDHDPKRKAATAKTGNRHARRKAAALARRKAVPRICETPALDREADRPVTAVSE